MNENELKYRFWEAVKSGEIKNNNRGTIPTVEFGSTLRVVEEAEFRAFDLVIAEVEVRPSRDIFEQRFGTNLTSVRTAMFHKIAAKQRCRIDCLQLFPIELKSDGDSLDERLGRQVALALFTFGNSIVVLDQKHSRNINKSGLVRALPSTVVTYSHSGGFEIASEGSTISSLITRNLDKRRLAALIGQSCPELNTPKLARMIELLHVILQKITYSQLFYPSPNDGLQFEEIEFLRSILCHGIPSNHRLAGNLERETSNRKLTEFLEHTNVDYS